MDPLSHSLLWSLLVNLLLYVGVSSLGTPSAVERRQAQRFVGAFRREAGADSSPWAADTPVAAVRGLLGRFIGDRARRPGARPAGGRARRGHLRDDTVADPELLAFAETPPRRHHRRRLGARRAGVGRQRAGARSRRGGGAPRRDFARARCQPRARGEVPPARSRVGGAAAGQRPPAGARSPQGRVPVDDGARAAHAAHRHSRLRRDPARQSRPLARRSAPSSSASSRARTSASPGSSRACSTSPSSRPKECSRAPRPCSSPTWCTTRWSRWASSRCRAAPVSSSTSPRPCRGSPATAIA